MLLVFLFSWHQLRKKNIQLRIQTIFDGIKKGRELLLIFSVFYVHFFFIQPNSMWAMFCFVLFFQQFLFLENHSIVGYQAPKLHDWRACLTTRPLPASQLIVYHCGLLALTLIPLYEVFLMNLKFVLSCVFFFSFFINLPIYSFIVILLIILYAKGLLWKRLNSLLWSGGWWDSMGSSWKISYIIYY